MGAFRRWIERLTESDESRLATEIEDWADSVAGCVRLEDAPMRQPVKIAGRDPTHHRATDEWSRVARSVGERRNR